MIKHADKDMWAKPQRRKKIPKYYKIIFLKY